MAATVEERTVGTPSVGGSTVFLLTTMPLGVFWFGFTVAVLASGIPLLLFWVGLPIAMFGMVTWRGGARLERARVRALLGRYIAEPYKPLPDGFVPGMKARAADPATWRDMVYLVLLFPVGLFWFVLFTTLWAVGLGLTTLWIWFRFLPNGEAPLFDLGDGHSPVVLVNSTLDALPWAIGGLLVLVGTALLSRACGQLHGRFTQAMLAPTWGQLRSADEEYRRRFMATTSYPGSPSNLDGLS
jgi:hypothetical protein